MKRWIKIIVILIPLIAVFYLGTSALKSTRWIMKTTRPPRKAQEQEVKLTERKPGPLKNITRLKDDALPPRKIAKPLHSLNLKLLGIGTVSNQNSPSLAWIRDVITDYKGHYKVGDRIKDAELVRIGYGEIELLRSNGTKEILQLEKTSSEKSGEGIISELSADKRIVDTDALLSKYQNPNNILKEITIVPDISKGKIRGFRLNRIESKSIVIKAGFKEGDVIKDVNGYSLTSPQAVINLYQQLKTQYNNDTIKTVEVGVQRNEKAKKLIYWVE